MSFLRLLIKVNIPVKGDEPQSNFRIIQKNKEETKHFFFKYKPESRDCITNDPSPEK